jgi:hypothetical protein
MKSSNALQSLAIFAVLTAAFALGPIIADQNAVRADQPGGNGIHMVYTPPPGPTSAQLQTEIDNLTKTVKNLQTAYNSHCHKMSGLAYVTNTVPPNLFPGSSTTQYYFVATPQSGAGSNNWQKTGGPLAC